MRRRKEVVTRREETLTGVKGHKPPTVPQGGLHLTFPLPQSLQGRQRAPLLCACFRSAPQNPEQGGEEESGPAGQIEDIKHHS